MEQLWRFRVSKNNKYICGVKFDSVVKISKQLVVDGFVTSMNGVMVEKFSKLPKK